MQAGGLNDVSIARVLRATALVAGGKRGNRECWQAWLFLSRTALPARARAKDLPRRREELLAAQPRGLASERVGPVVEHLCGLGDVLLRQVGALLHDRLLEL